MNSNFLFRLAAVGAAALTLTSVHAKTHFNRVATFPVCQQISATCDTDKETVAEIASVTPDGMTVVYTDSEAEQIGLVDISNPAKPQPKGTFGVKGEPTSVYVKGNYALVGVNTSESYTEPSGVLQVIDISNVEKPKKVFEFTLGGQPDSVAVSPDGKYIAVAIENERDEDLKVNGEEGDLPQAPAGKVVVIDSSDSSPYAWTQHSIDLTGLDGMLENTDPEPEYVDISQDNKLLVTLQENNHIVIIDLAKAGEGKASIINHFSAGSVTLDNVDAKYKKKKPRHIILADSVKDKAREPDGATWIDNTHFATANEGDWKGGSRGFTIFNIDGKVAYESGNTLEHETVAMGHFPDKRAGKKGNEPENAEYGAYGSDKLLFIASERSSLIFVYDVANMNAPVLKQVLPAGVGPEGVLAIPQRNLLVVASEKDDRKDKMRSAINVYQLQEGTMQYPTLRSATVNGLPIGWGALSALDAGSNGMLYTVNDSFYGKNSIFTIDAKTLPATITGAMAVTDPSGLMAKRSDKAVQKLVNKDNTINIDPEGVVQAKDGGFWVASEGSGTVGDEKKAYKFPNLVLKTNAKAEITDVVTLPQELTDVQLRFGLEGIEEYDGKLYVTFQRAWNKEANPRIGIYDIASKAWSFAYYPLDKAESQRKSWVGLSDIASLGNGQFLVLERDNQGGPDAAIKRIYKVDLANAKDGETLNKTLVQDLMKSGVLTKAGGLTPEKVEGLAVDSTGSVWIVNDNDGVDDNNGETQLINLGQL